MVTMVPICLVNADFEEASILSSGPYSSHISALLSIQLSKSLSKLSARFFRSVRFAYGFIVPYRLSPCQVFLRLFSDFLFALFWRVIRALWNCQWTSLGFRSAFASLSLRYMYDERNTLGCQYKSDEYLPKMMVVEKRTLVLLSSGGEQCLKVCRKDGTI